MLDANNPYAPPTAPLLNAGPEAPIWREGHVVVVPQPARFPCRCVRCNTPTEGPAKPKVVYWHHPALYLLLLLNIIIYAIVALIVRKSGTIDPGLCPQHRKARTLWIAAGWGGALLGIGVAITGLAGDSCGLGIAGALLFLGAIITSLIQARVLYPVRIDPETIRLKGAGAAFLASLPER